MLFVYTTKLFPLQHYWVIFFTLEMFQAFKYQLYDIFMLYHIVKIKLFINIFLYQQADESTKTIKSKITKDYYTYVLQKISDVLNKNSLGLLKKAAAKSKVLCGT